MDVGILSGGDEKSLIDRGDGQTTLGVHLTTNELCSMGILSQYTCYLEANL